MSHDDPLLTRRYEVVAFDAAGNLSLPAVLTLE